MKQGAGTRGDGLEYYPIEGLRVRSAKSLRMGDWTTAVTEDDHGAVYLAWVTPSAEAMLARRETTGCLSITRVCGGVTMDGHHKPAVAIDRRGYVHYVVDMHVHGNNDDPCGWGPRYPRPKNDNCRQKWRKSNSWQYWVSAEPWDVHTMQFVGDQYGTHDPQGHGLVGQFVTYPGFFKDNDGDLFVRFRHRVTQEYVKGTLSAGLAAYDADNRTWTMLGGNNYPGEHPLPGVPRGDATAMAWHWIGRAGTRSEVYQSLIADVFVDRENRIHYAVTVYTEGSRGGATWGGYGASHVLYAYSDDKGQSWHRVDGTPIDELPLTVNRASVPFAMESGGNLRGNLYVAVTKEGYPAISVSRRFDDSGAESSNRTFFTRWTGSEWTELRPLSVNEPGTPGGTLNRWLGGDWDGNLYSFRGLDEQAFYRSKDNGINWERFPAQGNRR